MNKFLDCLFVHFYLFTHARKAYIKYMWFCIKNRKAPNKPLVLKMVRVARFMKGMK